VKENWWLFLRNMLGQDIRVAKFLCSLSIINALHSETLQLTCDPQIFVLGFPKAGTTSLAFALNMSGYNVVHWEYGENYVGCLIYDAIKQGKKLLSFFDAKIDAFAQMDICTRNTSAWPQLILVPVLDMQYPCSKFVLNKRSYSAHIQSINMWGNLRSRIVHCDIPYLPAGVGMNDSDLIRLFRTHYENMRFYFKHRSNDFMEFDLRESRSSVSMRLSKFLNRTVHWTLLNQFDAGIKNRGFIH
jgi:hypothetical protein